MVFHRILVCSFLFSFSHLIQAQNKNTIDSINKTDYIYFSNNLSICKNLFEKNIEDSKKINYKFGEAEAIKLLGTIYCLKGDYEKGVSSFIEATKIFEKLKNYDKLATTYADIGFRIRYIDHAKGLYYFRLALDICKKHNVINGLSSIYNNYGEILKKHKIDSAIYYYRKSLNLARHEKNKIGVPFSLNNLVEAHAAKKEFALAFKYMDESDSYRFKGNDDIGKADNWAYRGDIYYEIPQIDSAIYYYKKSYNLAAKSDYNMLKRYCTERLANLYQDQGDHKKALIYFKLYKSYEDSVLNNNVQNQLANLQVEFETEKTQRELAEQKITLTKNELKLQSRQKWIIFSIGLSILLLVILFFVYRYQKTKRKSEIKEYDLKIRLESAELEKEFADEKIRIARELHDNIGSHLTFMISSLDNLAFIGNPEQKLDKIADLSNFGRLTMKDLRDTIWAMNHEGGTYEQLSARISELRSVLPNNLAVQIHSDLDSFFPFNGLQLLNCFRIVQEFIQNSIKYAESSKIEIIFTKLDGAFQLKLKDNGKGFDLKQVSFGNGIHNMKRRCEDLFGEFSINSSDQGTIICCEIPA